MATELAKAYVQIIPSAQGISGGIESAMNGEALKAGKSSGTTFSNAFSGGVSKGLKVVGGAATMAAAGLAAIGTTLVSNAKEAAAYGDEIDKMSQKVGMSAEAYQEWDYVLNISGTEMSSMTTGLKTLTNKFDDAKNGSKSAQAMFEALGLSMSDIAGLSREDLFSAVITGFQGMADSTERAALANDLFGKSGQELAPLFNTSAAETEALKQHVRELGGVLSDEAVKAAAAFTDAMTNLKTAATGAKNSLSANFLPALTEITNGFAALLSHQEGATEQLKSGFQNLGSAFSSVLPEIISGITAIVDAIAAVAPDIITSLVDGVMQALPQLISTVGQLVPQLVSSLVQMLPELVDVGFKMIIELGNGLAQAIPSLIPQIIDCVLQIIDTISQNLPQLVQMGVNIILALYEGILDALPQLIAQIPDIIINLVTALVQSLPLLVQGAVQLVTAVAQHAPEIIQKLVEAIPVIIKGLVTALTDPESVSQLIIAFIDLFIAVASAMPQIAMALIQAIPQVIVGIVEAFMELGPQLVSSLDQVILNVGPSFDRLIHFAQSAFQGIQTALAPVVSWMSNVFKSAVDAVKKAFGAVTSFFREIWEDITRIFSDALSRFKQIGKNIVEGIKQGISAAWNNLVEWFSKLFDDLIGIAKKILGIESPSKVFAKEVGQWIPAGIAEGIEEGMGVLDKEMKSMTDEALVGTIHTTSEAFNSVDYIPNSGALASEGKSVVINNTITVDGAQDPEAWTQTFIRTLKREARMA